MKFTGNNLYKSLIIIAILFGTVIFIRFLGLQQYISLENIEVLQGLVAEFGILAPIVYILLWVFVCLLFLPGLPVTILGAFLFEPLFAIVYASIGSTLGATLAFIVGRYAVRDFIANWIKDKEQLNKIDKGVEKHGWRMLIVTRLVPLFPFNLQNYIYGLTSIKLKTYMILSWACMLPATIAYILTASSIYKGEGNLSQTFIYLGIAGIIFFILSLIPRWFEQKGYIQDN